MLGNPAKRGKIVISNLREVLAKNAHGSDMKNLTIASPELTGHGKQLVCSQR
jgi:hypothetical protein